VIGTAIRDSARVQLIGGMFDLGVPKTAEATFEAQIPDMKQDWRIGAIVGPSGSGKTSLARAAFGKSLSGDRPWPARKAIVDCFGKIEVRKITAMLTAVGFSSPPAWIRPFATLSNGEQFRANLARALLTGGDLVVYDEFTSVVDRQVARIGSMAVAKSLRKQIIACRFVAVCCHYDILPWLQPDWTLDCSDYTLSRRRLRRPQIKLEISRCLPEAWSLFKRHHYLSAEMCTRAARCFLAIVAGTPVGFASIMPCPGLAGASRVSRIVVLPDWQGVGIGRAFSGWLGETYRRQGRRLYLRTSHAMMIRCLAGDTRWDLSAMMKYGSSLPIGDLSADGRRRGHQVSRRPGASFVYVGEESAEDSAPAALGLACQGLRQTEKQAKIP